MSVFLYAPLLTALSIILLRPIANALDLIDVPNQRKQHYGDVPLTGGISVFIAFTFVLISQGFFEPATTQNQVFYMCFMFIIFIGVLDDMYELSVITRLIGQLLVSTLFVFGTDSYILNLGVLWGTDVINISSTLGLILTVLAIMAAMNIFNMIDGMDSVLGTVSIVSLTVLASLFYVAGNDFHFTVSASLVLILLSFLAFNIFPIARFQYKTFMGDAGSMLIGLLMIWLLIEGSQGQESSVAFSPIMALYIIGLPLMDMVAIIIRRIFRNASPFKADHEHIHHLLVRSGKSTKSAKVIIPILSALIIGCGLAINSLAPVYMFTGFLILFTSYMVFTNTLIKKIKSK
ncbi:undecaprenyl-phosphate alpha-N-acetylglucosaminyl 1-phosphate transferase [Psychrosphaera haliotis]|uniref:Undecaprenyl-phosphate alpha-N-acetylglucosaminyl 1-phosphate transferase n=1 Tax=Psychrosphaera haliotis TaxID=555083 RepID=A0A6N8F908_9GAMM|nr:undecaprenyl-phosphate alpha-N-acetylglucosaminyl 1-phosphate transferase [Psychrosphaera haliotis]MUH71390.1 undecaprenyl-phosphate alpha-N-acetylglucosaminyl 1-phosphate transferase [Psychrosphaera haliotis]